MLFPRPQGDDLCANWDNFCTVGQFIQVIRPPLHHRFAFSQVFGAVVGSPHFIAFAVCKLALDDMFAPSDGGQPTAAAISSALGERFSRIFDNPYQRPDITGVELNVRAIPERRVVRLETARTDVTEVRPGDEIVVETALRPYRGERIVRQIPIRIPTSVPRGTLRILVSDGDTLDRMQRQSTLPSRCDLSSTIAMLNNRHANHRLYVSLLEANPQAMVQDKVMPALPLSVMNVMEGMRGTQDMIVSAESAVREASASLDYVVSGQQLITVNVR